MKIDIRNERPEDQYKVEKMTREAFWSQEQVDKMNIGATEHYLVHILRDKIALPELNLVACIDNEVVGHVLVNRDCYVVNESTKTEVLSLAPLTVAKPYQNQGIGTLLMNYCIDLARKTEYPAIIIYGHPNYYPRFGFKDARIYDITTETGDNFEAFMVLELHQGALASIKGRFIMSELFDEDKYLPKAIAFDKEHFSFFE